MRTLKDLCISTLKPYGSKDLSLKKTLLHLGLLPIGPVLQHFPELVHRDFYSSVRFIQEITYEAIPFPCPDLSFELLGHLSWWHCMMT